MSTLLVFDECEIQKCTELTIMNDTVLENTETFFVHLLRTPDLDRSVTLDPDIADLEITDNDGLYTQNTLMCTCALVSACADTTVKA